MRHHCHCGFREHFKTLRAKRLGFLGGALLVLHLLFHVVECLILPSILIGLGGHLAEEPAFATSDEVIATEPDHASISIDHYDFMNSSMEPFDSTNFYQLLP